MANNVYGQPLITCSVAPMTGFFRNGCCETGPDDFGTHTVCAVLTEDFLNYSKAQGNDLSTPRPEFQFSGLKPGDRWCLCVLRWLEAHQASKGPLLILEATHEKTLEVVDMATLEGYAHDYA